MSTWVLNLHLGSGYIQTLCHVHQGVHLHDFLTDNDGDHLVDEDTGHRQPYELVGGKEYVLTFMENAAEEFGQQIHLYIAVAPDVLTNTVDVTFRWDKLNLLMYGQNQQLFVYP